MSLAYPLGQNDRGAPLCGKIEELLLDEDLQGTDLIAKGDRQEEGLL